MGRMAKTMKKEKVVLGVAILDISVNEFMRQIMYRITIPVNGTKKMFYHKRKERVIQKLLDTYPEINDIKIEDRTLEQEKN